MQQVGHLQKLHEKYFDQGLRIVAITAEPTGTVEAAVVKQRGAKYWMASDPGRATMRRYTTKGRIGIPHSYLIDASGKVVGEGVPSDSRIEELLKDAFNPDLGKELDKSLASAVKLYEKGDYGKAWAKVARDTQDENRAVADDALFLQKRCEEVAKWHREQVEAAIASKDYATACDDLEKIVKAFDGMEIVTWAREKSAELAKDDAVQNELKAWKVYEKACKRLESAEGKEKKMGPARKAFEAVVKKYPGTRAAAMSEEALKGIPE